MKKENLPNFFIIGAAKSGTTALFDILNQHPEVYFPYQKEPNFFSNEKYYSKGLGWYEQTYFKNAFKYPARGEASPHYIYWSEKTADRIGELDGSKHIKIIALFRDPVKRAYSHYWMLAHRELEDLPFAEALKVEEERLKLYHDELNEVGSLRYGYFRGGQYASLLQPYLSHFPRENLHFILLDDLQNDFSSTMRDLASFLRIDKNFVFDPTASNPAYVPRNKRLHRFLHYPSGPIYQVIRAFLKKTPIQFQYRLRRKIVDINLKPSPNPPMDREVERNLRAGYQIEIELLEKIIGRTLDQWKANRG
jgi:hypothetical protein